MISQIRKNAHGASISLYATNMLQLPDFEEKQIVIVRAEKGEEMPEIRFKNENIALIRDGKVINQVSCHKVFALFIVGEATITTVLLRKALSYGVSVFLMKQNLDTYAAIGAMAEGNYVLRYKQYEFQDSLGFSKNLIKNKCYNQLTLLAEKNPDYFGDRSRHQAYKELSEKVDKAQNLDELLGLEGNSSKVFFKNYFGDLKWYRRLPRTKEDAPNYLLDLGYTLLFNFVDSILRLHGFDTYKGIYHQLFFQRKSLSCDIMEPFRCIIDNALSKGYGLGKVKEEDFKAVKGRYTLDFQKNREYVALFLDEIMKHKEDIFRYVKQFYFCVLNDGKDYPFYKYK
jgi:CRISP-associated protein Cas1